MKHRDLIRTGEELHVVVPVEGAAPVRFTYCDGTGYSSRTLNEMLDAGLRMSILRRDGTRERVTKKMIREVMG